MEDLDNTLNLYYYVSQIVSQKVFLSTITYNEREKEKT